LCQRVIFESSCIFVRHVLSHLIAIPYRPQVPVHLPHHTPRRSCVMSFIFSLSSNRTEEDKAQTSGITISFSSGVDYYAVYLPMRKRFPMRSRHAPTISRRNEIFVASPAAESYRTSHSSDFLRAREEGFCRKPNVRSLESEHERMATS